MTIFVKYLYIFDNESKTGGPPTLAYWLKISSLNHVIVPLYSESESIK